MQVKNCKPVLDLKNIIFSEFEFENEIVKRETFVYYPQSIGAYNGTMPIKFQVPAEVDKFTRLSSIRFMGDIKVKDKATNSGPTDDNWSLINNPIHSMFGQVSVGVEGHEIVDRLNKFRNKRKCFTELTYLAPRILILSKVTSKHF